MNEDNSGVPMSDLLSDEVREAYERLEVFAADGSNDDGVPCVGRSQASRAIAAIRTDHEAAIQRCRELEEAVARREATQWTPDTTKYGKEDALRLLDSPIVPDDAFICAKCFPSFAEYEAKGMREECLRAGRCDAVNDKVVVTLRESQVAKLRAYIESTTPPAPDPTPVDAEVEDAEALQERVPDEEDAWRKLYGDWYGPDAVSADIDALHRVCLMYNVPTYRVVRLNAYIAKRLAESQRKDAVIEAAKAAVNAEGILDLAPALVTLRNALATLGGDKDTTE